MSVSLNPNNSVASTYLQNLNDFETALKSSDEKKSEAALKQLRLKQVDFDAATKPLILKKIHQIQCIERKTVYQRILLPEFNQLAKKIIQSVNFEEFMNANPLMKQGLAAKDEREVHSIVDEIVNQVLPRIQSNSFSGSYAEDALTLTRNFKVLALNYERTHSWFRRVANYFTNLFGFQSEKAFLNDLERVKKLILPSKDMNKKEIRRQKREGLTYDQIGVLNLRKAIAGGFKGGLALFRWAARGGHTELVKDLMVAGVPPDEFMHSAIESGNIDTVKVLLAAGADCEEREIVSAFRQGSIPLIALLLQSSPVLSTNPKLLFHLISANLNPEQYKTALNYLTKAAVKEGVNLNITFHNNKAHSRQTSVLAAVVLCSDFESMELLLKHGVTPTLADFYYILRYVDMSLEVFEKLLSHMNTNPIEEGSFTWVIIKIKSLCAKETQTAKEIKELKCLLQIIRRCNLPITIPINAVTSRLLLELDTPKQDPFHKQNMQLLKNFKVVFPLATVGKKEFKCNNSLLMAGSDFFKGMFEGDNLLSEIELSAKKSNESADIPPEFFEMVLDHIEGRKDLFAREDCDKTLRDQNYFLLNPFRSSLGTAEKPGFSFLYDEIKDQPISTNADFTLQCGDDRLNNIHIHRDVLYALSSAMRKTPSSENKMTLSGDLSDDDLKRAVKFLYTADLTFLQQDDEAILKFFHLCKDQLKLDPKYLALIGDYYYALKSSEALCAVHADRQRISKDKFPMGNFLDWKQIEKTLQLVKALPVSTIDLNASKDYVLFSSFTALIERMPKTVAPSFLLSECSNLGEKSTELFRSSFGYYTTRG